MTPVAEAKKIISDNSVPLKPLRLPLLQAAGSTLAEDIISPIDLPNYPQSSMDGYAFRYEDLQAYTTLEITGELAAGASEPTSIKAGTAVRIFTGAPVPVGADTVVMQERTKIENGKLIINDDSIAAGSNIRPRGIEIRSGQPALEKDSLLNPAAVGFLASLGIESAWVYPLPTVSIIATGNELQAPGQLLAFGQVYDSNSSLLQAALHQMNIRQIHLYVVKDKLELLVQALGKALIKSDVVCLTGGVSVGDYDYVAAAARENGIHKLFHKIKQKPGKPFYFGKKEDKLVFGLPGNPASVLTCFYEYAEPALKKLSKQASSIKTIHAPITKNFKKPAGLTHFLKGYYDGHSVTPLPAQESFRLISFARANCLVQIGEETTICNAGEIVEVHLLP